MLYLLKLSTFDRFLHTNYKPVGGPRYHGNPIKGWQDWVTVLYGQKHYMCQILIFLNVIDVNVDNHINFEVGRYALVHFINENVFGDVPENKLYGKEYDNFCIDKNCNLVRGWLKKTNMITHYKVPANAQQL